MAPGNGAKGLGEPDTAFKVRNLEYHNSRPDPFATRFFKVQA